MKWEMTTLNLEQPNYKIRNRIKFKKLGEEGWELIQITNGIAYFKRELTPDAEQKEKRAAQQHSFLNHCKIVFAMAPSSPYAIQLRNTLNKLVEEEDWTFEPMRPKESTPDTNSYAPLICAHCKTLISEVI